MLNTVLADAVLRTLCWQGFGRIVLGTQLLAGGKLVSDRILNFNSKR